VRETEAGLRELRLDDIADCFVEAHAIVNPLKPEITKAKDYSACLRSRRLMERIDELTDKALSTARWSLQDLGNPKQLAIIRFSRCSEVERNGQKRDRIT
jgi:hypothetical protein